MIAFNDVRIKVLDEMLCELGDKYFRVCQADKTLGIYPRVTAEHDITIKYRRSDYCVLVESPKSVYALGLDEFSKIEIF